MRSPLTTSAAIRAAGRSMEATQLSTLTSRLNMMDKNPQALSDQTNQLPKATKADPKQNNNQLSSQMKRRIRSPAKYACVSSANASRNSIWTLFECSVRRTSST